MTLDLFFFALAIPAVLFAGISKGGFGSGAAFAATPLLALILDPLQAVAMMMPILIVIDLTTIGPYWRRWSWPEARVLTLGGLVGVTLGWLLVPLISPDLVRFLIGVIALGFVAFQLLRSRGALRLEGDGTVPHAALKGAFWGGVAGLTSFISHAGGPPAAVYLLGQRLDKLRYQATTVLVFSILNFVKFGFYAMLGLFSVETTTASAILAPVGVLGAILGVYAHHRIPERWFFRLTYIFLGITGAKLILDAVT